MAISLTGMILKGRYCILEQIGSGGNGHLYLARDLELGSLWAVKEIPLSQKKEAKLLRLLEHPSLPRMVDYLEREDNCYLVMEYIRGKSLARWMEEGRIFSAEEVVKLGVSIAQVMEYLHSRKPPVYYGDLKPENLMLSETGKLCLVDFGSAVMGYQEQQRVCQGTKGYAAPEQYQGRIGKASDVYALGKTLWALCGKKGWKYVCMKPGLGLLLVKCCCKEEKYRLSDMKAVEKGLEHILRQRVQVKAVGLAVVFLVFMLTAAGLLLPGEKSERDFRDALTELTEMYYQKEFLEGDFREKKVVCEKAEEHLLELLQEYKGKEEQRKLLLLLAWNEELQDEEERAALYYEQLMLYHEEFDGAYAEYGLFLCRQGKEEQSRSVWRDFQEKEGLQETGKEKDGNVSVWKERMEVRTDEKSGDSRNDSRNDSR